MQRSPRLLQLWKTLTLVSSLTDSLVQACSPSKKLDLPDPLAPTAEQKLLSLEARFVLAVQGQVMHG